MSKLRKMSQTQLAKSNFKSDMLPLLNEVRTKQELSELLGISERAVRDEISQCSMYYAVIATSDKSGYRLAKAIKGLDDETLLEELNEVNHAIHEISSRIKCLKKRLKPLIAYKKVAEKKLLGQDRDIEDKENENEESRLMNNDKFKNAR